MVICNVYAYYGIFLYILPVPIHFKDCFHQTFKDLHRIIYYRVSNICLVCFIFVLLLTQGQKIKKSTKNYWQCGIHVHILESVGIIDEQARQSTLCIHVHVKVLVSYNYGLKGHWTNMAYASTFMNCLKIYKVREYHVFCFVLLLLFFFQD